MYPRMSFFALSPKPTAPLRTKSLEFKDLQDEPGDRRERAHSCPSRVSLVSCSPISLFIPPERSRKVREKADTLLLSQVPTYREQNDIEDSRLALLIGPIRYITKVDTYLLKGAFLAEFISRLSVFSLGTCGLLQLVQLSSLPLCLRVSVGLGGMYGVSVGLSGLLLLGLALGERCLANPQESRLLSALEKIFQQWSMIGLPVFWLSSLALVGFLGSHLSLLLGGTFAGLSPILGVLAIVGGLAGGLNLLAMLVIFISAVFSGNAQGCSD